MDRRDNPGVEMMRLAMACMCILMVFVAAAAAQNLSNLDGSWVCQSGCGCSPASPHRYASISAAKNSARNECGQETALTASGNRIGATDWGVGATVSPDGLSINWDNGSVWARLPPSASELEIRMAYWESRVFYCPSTTVAFPSKEAGGGTCDDGDSVMFNALLCRAGDPRGCNAVKLSQDDTGRFWRSPYKLQIHPLEAPGLKDGQTTFSGDHAVGLFLYFGHTGKADAFERWVKWIDSNERCLSFCGPMPVGTPRYCQNDRCAFRVGDCQTLLLLARKLGVALPICLDAAGTTPSVAMMAYSIRRAYNETIGRFPVPPPGLKVLQDNFDKALKEYEEAVAPIELLRTKLAAEVVQRQNLSQFEKALTAKFNAPGYARHNALVQVMMLQDWGAGTDFMSSEARRVAENDPLNPFFQYVAYRRTDKGSMLPLILSLCPAKATDVVKSRSQWAWERDSAEKAWNETMYWDCLFAGAMYLDREKTPPDDNSTEDSLRTALEEAVKQVKEKLGTVQNVLKQIMALPDPTTVTPDPAAAQQILNQARDWANRTGEAIERTGKAALEKLF